MKKKLETIVEDIYNKLAYLSEGKELDISEIVSKARVKQAEAEQDAQILLMNVSASAFKQFAGGAKIAARLQQTAATIHAYRTNNKIMADP